MAKGTRITLTKSEAESTAGHRLIDIIISMVHDERLEFSEVKELHAFLSSETSDIAAIHYLRAITRDVVADGIIDDAEAYRLKLAFERVVPKEHRGIVSTHLQGIGLPAADEDGLLSAWTQDPATPRQIAYIIDLGGSVTDEMTKGEASRLIEQLLERRPPTPRQMMLLRFFSRLDLAESTKDDVSQWIDELYSSDSRLERAWDRFKRETDHDPRGQDPSIVPIGAFKEYVETKRRHSSLAWRILAWAFGRFKPDKRR